MSLQQHACENLMSGILTPWCRVPLEKLTGLQLVKKFPAFHETRRFITALTRVSHLSLSWASPIQSIYPRPTSWRSILVLSIHLRLGLPSGLLPSGSYIIHVWNCDTFFWSPPIFSGPRPSHVTHKYTFTECVHCVCIASFYLLIIVA